MRSKLVSVLILGAVFALSLGAAKGPGPKATGDITWRNDDPGQKFTAEAVFTAQEKNGDAKGHVFLDVVGDLGAPPSKTFSYSGTVLCYEQDGNVATFGGTIDEHSGPGATSHFVVTVEDNGQGAATSPDRIATQRRNGLRCDELPLGRDVTEGNLQVHTGN